MEKNITFILDPLLKVDEQLAESAIPITEKVKTSLYKKSKNSGISTDILEEIYSRGYHLWNEEFKGTREQFAFDRVNSFISGGFAADLDKDLYEQTINFDKHYGKTFRVTDPEGDPKREGFSMVTPENGAAWSGPNAWKERPQFKKIVRDNIHNKGVNTQRQYLGDKYNQILISSKKLNIPIDENVNEESLHDWFSKSKSKSGKKGWVQVGGRYDGEACARQPGQKTTPKCRPSREAAKMSKTEKKYAHRKKQKEDPNQPQKSGAAKPTYVKTYKEENINEEKDACYHKVKARYKVWPSAYASGALVKCRKKGAKNWGNKSVKEETELNKKVLTIKEISKKFDVPLDYVKEQLKVGISVEKEHTSDNITAKRIALAHLSEKPDYYKKLKKVGLEEGFNDRKTVIETLKSNGFELHREGGDHEKWRHPPTGVVVAVPRHKTFSPNVVGNIRRGVKQAVGKIEEAVTPTAEKQSKNPDKSSSRFDGTNSLVKVFKDTTPGQSEKEISNMKEETLFNKIKRVLELDEAKSPAWQRKEGKNPEGGLNKKGVASYRAQNPGSKLQTAVTTDPKKLKKGSKKAKRRLSFCRRMKGLKNKLTSTKTARDPNSRVNKSLRKWNC